MRMGIVGKILNALTKRYQWDPRGIYWNSPEHHPSTDPTAIHKGDIVEYAIEWTDGIQYLVQNILPDQNLAEIKAIRGTLFHDETYPAPLSMLRRSTAQAGGSTTISGRSEQ